ncbi:LexA family protein [Lysinibacter cavernae]|uniref:LexA family protein n=1 Tax=Lysinibacter cavernae TaxID=1640652 RepID=UPI0036205EDE
MKAQIVSRVPAADAVKLIQRAPEAVSAGFPSPAAGYYTGPLDLNEHLITDPISTFVMRVSGESMLGAGIFDGDEMIVNRSRQPVHGDIVVAIIDSEMTVKRLLVAGGSVILRAENPRYPDIRLTEFAELEIWGVVEWCLHRV